MEQTGQCIREHVIRGWDICARSLECCSSGPSAWSVLGEPRRVVHRICRLHPFGAFSELSRSFLGAFSELSPSFLGAFSELSRSFLRAFSELSRSFLGAFSERSRSFLGAFSERSLVSIFYTFHLLNKFQLSFQWQGHATVLTAEKSADSLTPVPTASVDPRQPRHRPRALPVDPHSLRRSVREAYLRLR